VPGPLSRYVAWCDTNYFVHSQERGTPHSDIGLLFRFQRPSNIPGRETESRFRPRQLFGVTRTTVIRLGGRHLHQPSVAVKRICRHEFGMPPSGGRVQEYSPGSLGVKRWHLDCARPRLTPSPAQVIQEFPRNSRSLLCDAIGHPPLARPGIRTFSGSHSVRGGRLVASLAGCVNCPVKKYREPAPVRQRDQGTQAERSTRETPAAAATEAASGSERPARRARAAREMARRRTTASSSWSLTSTYS
jgi:hypothetical protein